MAKASIFRNFNFVENKSLIVISKEIAEGKYKPEIEVIRSLVAEGKHDEVDRCKERLVAFTPSATFKGQRILSNLDEYSGFVHLDFDSLSPEQVEEAFKIIAGIPYTFLCFRSPRGNGLKVFVEVNTGALQHDIAYKQVQQYYEEQVGLKSDPKCKDITRLCFVSFDILLHKNLSNKKFIVESPPPPPPSPSTHQIPDNNSGCAELLTECLQETEKKKTYSDGNRNEFIYYFASIANRKGIPHEIALQYCLNTFDLPEKEIRASFQSAYTHHKEEFAKSANIAKLQSHTSEDYLKNTPLIPEELYQQMPDIIREGAEVFHLGRERDVFLTGALPILSGCLPGIKGVYDGQEVFPNLYSFAVAPAASGKGALKFAKMLADVYHATVLRTSRDAEEEYNKELAEHKARQRAKKKSDTEVEEAPQKPPFKVIFIPANTSYAKILSHLEQNEGFGIICETEADTMGNVFKQDWGGYSDMLRKAFHHERISSSRKADNEFIEVNDPRLSVTLTGTPGQVTGLITSSEDGLFSRFLFYAFKVEPQWKDVSPKANRVNLTEHFKKLAERLFEMVQFLQSEETVIELSETQWNLLNQNCSCWLQDVTMFTAEEAASIVKRMGLVIYRLSMVFTAMRKFENGESTSSLICSDEDFSTALKLAEIFLQHGLLMFNNLPKQTEQTHFKGGDNKRKFLDALPQEFSRQEAVALARQFAMSVHTADNFLKSLLDTRLSQPKTGHYRKL